jgi:hypothetical protein
MTFDGINAGVGVSEVPFKAQTVLPSDKRFKRMAIPVLRLYIANHREL